MRKARMGLGVPPGAAAWLGSVGPAAQGPTCVHMSPMVRNGEVDKAATKYAAGSRGLSRALTRCLCVAGTGGPCAVTLLCSCLHPRIPRRGVVLARLLRPSR